MIYVPLLVNRSQKIILLIVSVSIWNPVPEILFSSIWSSAQDHAVLVLWLSLVGFFISTRPSWSGGNVLYHRGTSWEVEYRGDQPLHILAWFIRSGGTYLHVEKNEIRPHASNWWQTSNRGCCATCWCVCRQALIFLYTYTLSSPCTSVYVYAALISFVLFHIDRFLYIYTYIYTYVYVYMYCTSVYAYVGLITSVLFNIDTSVCIYIYIYIYMYIYIMYIFKYIHIHCIYIDTYQYICICKHIFTFQKTSSKIQQLVCRQKKIWD